MHINVQFYRTIKRDFAQGLYTRRGHNQELRMNTIGARVVGVARAVGCCRVILYPLTRSRFTNQIGLLYHRLGG
jgi:hypothetical protein